MQDLVKQLAEKLIDKKMMIVTAESCTGGLLSSSLISTPGASAFFERGYITYSDKSKQDELGVPDSTLMLKGAVSNQVAESMATGALRHSGADIAVSITGIAGPEGGTNEKPVGTVYFGFAVKGGSSISAHKVYEGDRNQIQEKAVITALETLITIMNKQP